MNKIEKVRYIINRLDHYIETINSKANLVLACNAVIIGGILTGFAFGSKIELSCYQRTWLILTIFCGLTSCLCTVIAVLPFTRSRGTETEKSLFFFKDIVSYTLQDYVNFLNDQTEHSEFIDLATQAHNISEGLKQKFSKMRVAVLSLFAEIIFIVFFILTIVTQ
jgi:hypothetical protein